jgi:hypothetical protein
MSSQLSSPTALPPRKEPRTEWVGGCVGTRAGLDIVAKKISLPLWESNLGLRACCLVTILTELSGFSIRLNWCKTINYGKTLYHFVTYILVYSFYYLKLQICPQTYAQLQKNVSVQYIIVFIFYRHVEFYILRSGDSRNCSNTRKNASILLYSQHNDGGCS